MPDTSRINTHAQWQRPCDRCANKRGVEQGDTQEGVTYTCTYCGAYWKRNPEDSAYSLLNLVEPNQYRCQTNATRATALALLAINTNLSRIAKALEVPRADQ